MEEKEDAFGIMQHRFYELFRDFIFYSFLRDSFTNGEPSEFLSDLSKHFHDAYERVDMKKDFPPEEMDSILKDKAKELYEIMKVLYPDVVKNAKKEDSNEKLKSKVNELEKRLAKLEKK